ncbi:MAG: Ca2+-binding actin-bundling protein (actinin), alpha chain (EF-Hand protein superfamily) [Marteilia pararefringens]
MGISTSHQDLLHDEAQALCDETGFSISQINKFYYRFSNLDSGSKGYLSKEDLMKIPELFINPLCSRIIQLLFGERNELLFGDFVRNLSIFQLAKSKKFNFSELIEKKYMYIFLIYDRDGDGVISKQDMSSVVRLMVGQNITEVALNNMVKTIFLQIGVQEETGIDFEKFKNLVLEDKIREIVLNF